MHPGCGGSGLLHDGLHVFARADDQPLLPRRRRNLHDLARMLWRRSLPERPLLSPVGHGVYREHPVLHGLHVPVRDVPRAHVYAHRVVAVYAGGRGSELLRRRTELPAFAVEQPLLPSVGRSVYDLARVLRRAHLPLGALRGVKRYVRCFDAA